MPPSGGIVVSGNDTPEYGCVRLAMLAPFRFSFMEIRSA
jgi:hypothetical protein